MGADLAWSSVRCKICGVEGGQPCNPVGHIEAAQRRTDAAFERAGARIAEMLAEAGGRVAELEELCRRLWAKVPAEAGVDPETKRLAASVPRMPARGQDLVKSKRRMRR